VAVDPHRVAVLAVLLGVVLGKSAARIEGLRAAKLAPGVLMAADHAGR
jgi:hypothetical protein